MLLVKDNILLFTIFILLFLIFFTIKYQKKINFILSYAEIKTSFLTFQRYIDRYYISDVYYTIFATFIYIFFNFILLIVIRYLLLGNFTDIMQSRNAKMSFVMLLYFFSHIMLVILCIILLKHLIERLFYLDIIKLRIYFDIIFLPKDPLNVFHYTQFKVVTNLFGRRIFTAISCICFRIAFLSFRKDFFNREFDEYYQEQISDDESYNKNLYANKSLVNIIEFLQSCARKYKLISNIFYILAIVFKFLANICRDNTNRLFNGFFVYIPFSLMFLCFIYEIYNKELHYIYYFSFVYLFIYFFQRYRKFESCLSDYPFKFYKYFYENDINYNSLRGYIFSETIKKDPEKESNQAIYFKEIFNMFFEKAEPTAIFYSVLNNMERSKEDIICQIDKKYRMIYIRAHIIIVFVLIGIFILFQPGLFIVKFFDIYISKTVIFVPLVFMIICGRKAYSRKLTDKFTLDEGHVTTNDSSAYAKLFWILAFMQSYILWAILLKSSLMFTNSEAVLHLFYILALPDEIVVLFNNNVIEEISDNTITINIINITKIYTIKEKIMYLFQCVEMYTQQIDYLHNEFPEKIRNSEEIRHIFRQKNFEEIISKNISLQDIQNYVRQTIETNLYKEQTIRPELKKEVKGIFYWLQRILGLKK